MKASLRVQVFLYYIHECENKSSTKIFPQIKQDLNQFLEEAKIRVAETLGCDVSELTSKENWAIKTEQRIIAEEKIIEEREWLIKEGFLWKTEYGRFVGYKGHNLSNTYVGLTAKGKAYAPKYLAKYEPYN